MKSEIPRQILKKKLNIEFHENPLWGGGRVVLCGRKDGQTRMKTVILASRNLEDAPKDLFNREN